MDPLSKVSGNVGVPRPGDVLWLGEITATAGEFWLTYQSIKTWTVADTDPRADVEMVVGCDGGSQMALRSTERSRSIDRQLRGEWFV